MLVLTRKAGESIRIGEEIEVRIVSVRGQKVRIAIEAPRDVNVRRGELESENNRLRLAAETARTPARRRAVS